jgi:hypothetical protein
MTKPPTLDELSALVDWLGRLTATVENAAASLDRALAEVRGEQLLLRDDHIALSNRLESLTRLVSERTDHLA